LLVWQSYQNVDLISPDELDFNGVTKKISSRNHRLNTVDELKRELVRFIRTIEQENFNPKENEHNKTYE
jgi:hypothetical protein